MDFLKYDFAFQYVYGTRIAEKRKRITRFELCIINAANMSAKYKMELYFNASRKNRMTLRIRMAVKISGMSWLLYQETEVKALVVPMINNNVLLENIVAGSNTLEIR